MEAERGRYLEQRKEVYDALDSDLATLEQLKEQKSLLKSIRLRKEELKALEGRRVALEALRKIANQSEAELDRALGDGAGEMRSSSSCGALESLDRSGGKVVANARSHESAEVAGFVEGEGVEDAESKLKQVSDLCRFLEMLKEKQVIFWQWWFCLTQNGQQLGPEKKRENVKSFWFLTNIACWIKLK